MTDDTRFTREIVEQPDALRDLVRFYESVGGTEILERLALLVKGRRRILFTGMGTSLYAPGVLADRAGAFHAPVEMRDAGELLHFGLDSLTFNDVVIAVSQSGESAETREVALRLRDVCPVAAIVNDTASSIPASAVLTLPMRAGNEHSISTKTHVNTLALLMIIADVLSGGVPVETLRILRTAADLMERDMERSASMARTVADIIGDAPHLHVIARGSDLATARQFALIAKEGAGLFTEALSAGLMRHGPVELAGPGHTALFFLSGNNAPALTASLARDLCGWGSTVAVAADETAHIPGTCGGVTVPAASPGCFPIACAPFIGFLVHCLALDRGREAGVFRHARKVTDSEWTTAENHKRRPE